MESRGLLYPVMVVAGIAVTVASLLGIAAITGYLPQAHSESQMSPARPAESGGVATGSANHVLSAGYPAALRPTQVAVVQICHTCGHIQDIYARRIQGQTSGVGMVAGGVLGGVLGNQIGNGNGRTVMTVLGAVGGGYAGNQVEKARDTHVVYVVKVHMDDGSQRTFIRHYPPRFSIGEPVRIEGSQIYRRS